jgi:hypothetical protein
MTTKSEELKAILQVLKDFDLSSVKLKMQDVEIECQFSKTNNAAQSTKKAMASLFPEAKYGPALMTPQSVTPEELQELGMMGVIPMGTPVSDLMPPSDELPINKPSKK